ncbi:MAG: FMN-dependent NADH-azoreductase [Immundisolibacter sp.]|uniref:FMN-dependent NADH-azoreductase n=1 Tax=Immundisolibacter sp. TaxID=1934948 RepID=UPI003D14F71E
MARLLVISFTPKGPLSRTRRLLDAWLARRRATDPALDVNEVDLVNTELPPVDGPVALAKGSVAAGSQLAATQQRAWDAITPWAREFLAADEVAIAAPMWNFGLPYPVKHYLDVIVQPGLLFRYTAQGPQGLCAGKPLTLVTTRGNAYADLPQVNFQTNYLRWLCEFIDCRYAEVVAEGLDVRGPEAGEQALAERIARL